jgi:hypothetical protein
MPQHDSAVVAAGTALNILSVTGGVATALGIADAIGPDVAWLVAPFGAGVAYLTLEAAETLVAERLLRHRGDPEAEKTEG